MRRGRRILEVATLGVSVPISPPHALDQLRSDIGSRGREYGGHALAIRARTHAGKHLGHHLGIVSDVPAFAGRLKFATHQTELPIDEPMDVVEIFALTFVK